MEVDPHTLTPTNDRLICSRDLIMPTVEGMDKLATPRRVGNVPLYKSHRDMIKQPIVEESIIETDLKNPSTRTLDSKTVTFVPQMGLVLQCLKIRQNSLLFHRRSVQSAKLHHKIATVATE